jgi:N-acetylmuramoyl-L-alanine amidase
MNYKFNPYILVTFLFSILFFTVFSSVGVFKENTTNFLASVFFSKSIYTEDIIDKYDDALSKKKKEKVKILIVPGHDNKSFGAYANNTTEAEINLAVAKELKNILEREKGIEILLSRDDTGYNSKLQKYLEEEKDDIEDFQLSKKKIMNDLIQEGKVESNIVVHHNFARPEVVDVLYGINKFANDNKFDITIHIHFNDYPGRTGAYGKHSGFSIYVPEKQYSNAEASYEFAEKVSRHLAGVFAISDLPKEGMITEDQELIAVGSYNTADSVVALVEYGYIYESQFTDPEIKDVVLKELAQQTHYGIMDYLNDENSDKKTFGNFVDYEWKKDILFGDRGLNVLALQDYLHDHGHYPVDENLNECPLNGNFRNCTKNSLIQFQLDKNLNPTGFLDKTTRQIINQ